MKIKDRLYKFIVTNEWMHWIECYYPELIIFLLIIVAFQNDWKSN